MNNKGFTLIELMAVIIILAVIGLIIFPSAIESINNSKEKLYKEQVERILDAADSWASSNDSKLPSGDESIVITVDELQRAGLLKHEDIKNPIDSNKDMSQKVVIYYDSEYNQYVSVYCDSEYGSYYYKDNEISNINNICNDAGITGNKSDSVLLGDVNSDGKVDSIDRSLLAQYVANNGNIGSTAFNKTAADLDNSGEIDITDLVILIRIINTKNAVLLGDVNSDGKVDSIDRELLAQYVANNGDIGSTAFNKTVADLDNNGEIDITDVVILTRIING